MDWSETILNEFDVTIVVIDEIDQFFFCNLRRAADVSVGLTMRDCDRKHKTIVAHTFQRNFLWNREKRQNVGVDSCFQQGCPTFDSWNAVQNDLDLFTLSFQIFLRRQVDFYHETFQNNRNWDFTTRQTIWAILKHKFTHSSCISQVKYSQEGSCNASSSKIYLQILLKLAVSATKLERTFHLSKSSLKSFKYRTAFVSFTINPHFNSTLIVLNVVFRQIMTMKEWFFFRV